MKEQTSKQSTPILKKKAQWTLKRETIFTLLLVAVGLYAFLDALTFPFNSGLYPMVIALICFGLATGQVILELHQKVLVKEAMDVKVEESQRGRPAMKRAVRFLTWFLGGFYLGTYLFGFQVVVLPWLVSFLFFEGHIKLWKVLIVAAVMGILVLWVMPNVLQMDAPTGLLQDWLQTR